MKTPSNSRIVLEDFPNETQSWVSKLLGPFNSLLQQLKTGFDKGLTVNDNFMGKITTCNFTGKQYSIAYNSTPKIVIVGYCYDNTAKANATTLVEWSYSSNNNTLSLNFPSLTDGHKYTCNLLILED